MKEEIKDQEPIEETAEQAIIEEQEETKPKLPPGTKAPVRYQGGGFHEFVFIGEIPENPEFKSVCRDMGIDPVSSEARSRQNDIADITKMVYEWLQTDDADEVSKFIRHQLRRTPSSGSRVLNLKRNLQLLIQGMKKS